MSQQTKPAVSGQVFSIRTRKPIDEDDLLTEEDKQGKQGTAAKEDCTTRKRACKNCVCGRAEAERQGEKVSMDVNAGPPPGGCGNCSRGDAFRCASCPYLGQPAWSKPEVGSEVKLNLSDDI